MFPAFTDYLLSLLDTFIADEDRGTFDKNNNLALPFAAERAVGGFQ